MKGGGKIRGKGRTPRNHDSSEDKRKGQRKMGE